MASLEGKVEKAYKDMKRLYGMPEAKVKAALNRLLRLYGDAWGLIEENNYEVLFECCIMGDKQEQVEQQKEPEKFELKTVLDDALKDNSEPLLSDELSKSVREKQDEAEDEDENVIEARPPPQFSNKRDRASRTETEQDIKGKKPAIAVTAGGRALDIVNNETATVTQRNALNLDLNSYPDKLSQKKLPLVVIHLDKNDKDYEKGNSKNQLSSNVGACIGRAINPPFNVPKNPIFVEDITRGEEKQPISLVNDNGALELPKLFYISKNIGYKNAYVNFSLARIGDENCCSNCYGDCLSAPANCACTGETRGDFAYTSTGVLQEKFLNESILISRRKVKAHLYYCENCPLENSLVKSSKNPKRKRSIKPCKGHVVRKFIKECWVKCGCNKSCGNRVVQRGITAKLQVFQTSEGKGWGVRTLEALEKGTFVCEYVGEIVTNQELDERNEEFSSDQHTYPVLLDADWASERHLKDEEALCLDATKFGNVARFINHRCYDANLIEIPVEIETPDHHYYHVAFFTTRKVKANEELNWDYGIDFTDKNHPIKAFDCKCGSIFCGMKSK